MGGHELLPEVAEVEGVGDGDVVAGDEAEVQLPLLAGPHPPPQARDPVLGAPGTGERQAMVL